MNLVAKVLRRVRRTIKFRQAGADSFLPNVCGVIHVGASTGQERYLYQELGLLVVWIEPLPKAFQQLQANIEEFPRQVAINDLVSNADDVEYDFYLASNGGASSSILPMSKHLDMFPEVTIESTLKIVGYTLPTILDREHVDLKKFDALVLDTQGSELLVLNGAASILPFFKFIKVEAADFEAYEGCAQVKDIVEFMQTHGFREIGRYEYAKDAQIGTYYDLIFIRR
ncbi:MAG: FkbM family methyltransferase [Chlorobia bacterium]|nr:FkbM family methyltransferase [Fimbriimonadaceae bacterium]